MNRHPTYWKAYHASRMNVRSYIFKLAMRIVEAIGSPWRIAKPKFKPELHAAYTCAALISPTGMQKARCLDRLGNAAGTSRVR